MRLFRAVAFVAIAALVACRGEGTATSTSAATTPVTGDLCEHGVLAMLCPQCHPALVSIYQSHGDWCAEHQMPESICPVCHPERGGRPTATVDAPNSAGDVATDGTLVTLAGPEVPPQMGLETTALGAPSGSVSIRATARLIHDLSRVARLGARVPGIVSEVRVDVGQRVAVGDPLAWIDSTSVAADRSRLAAAVARRTTAEAAEARLEELRASGISSERDLLAARQEAAAARAEHGALSASLRAVGGGRSSRYAVTSPIDGLVTARSAVVGSAAGTDDVLFEIVDASRLFAELAIPERDAARVQVGYAVTLHVLGAEETFEGPLAFVAPQIDPHTRTVTGRASFSNDSGLLRANALADAEIAVPTSDPGFEVSRVAVQHVGDVAMVFVRMTETSFEVRRVEVLAESDEDSMVVSGRLATGDQVVTSGSFFLRTETMRDSIGAGCCEAEE